MSYYNFTKNELNIFNNEFPEGTRKSAMSVYASIKKLQNKITGYLDFSLDYIFRYKYKNNLYLTLPNFRKIADKLVKKGLLTFIRKGEKLKFYGTLIFDGKIRENKKKDLIKENEDLLEEIEKLKKENKLLKEENSRLKDGVSYEEINKNDCVTNDEGIIESIDSENNIKFENEKNIEHKYDKIPMIEEEIKKLACEIMKAEKIRVGSTVHRQVIESLVRKIRVGEIHKQGAVSYISEVIKDKRIKQQSFSEKFRSIISTNKFKNKLNFHNYEGRSYSKEYMDNLEKKLLGWD